MIWKVHLENENTYVPNYQRVVETLDTHRSGGRPPVLGESPGGLIAKEY